MIPLTIILLLATSAFADYSNNLHQTDDSPDNNFQMDSYNRHLSRPSKLYFNFEQLRKDQPPQLEIRDEDIGRYMYRSRTTTLATPSIPSLQQYPEHFSGFQKLRAPEPHLNHQETTPKPYIGPNWNEIINSHLPATLPPPPPSPKWMDLSGAYELQQHSYPVNQNYEQSYQALPHSLQPTQAPAFQWAKHGIMPQDQREQNVHSVHPRIDAYDPVLYNAGVHNLEQQSMPASDYVQSANSGIQPIQSRGSHKFHLDKFHVPQEPTTTKVPIKVQNRNPPPVPTLTPWSGDNFGK